MVYVADELVAEFNRKLPTWVKKAKGPTVRPFDIDVQEVDGQTYKTLAKYVIKGINPLYVDYLHLGDFAEPQGRVWGRRASSSASLNKAARKAAGFVPKRDRDKWRVAANANSNATAA